MAISGRSFKKFARIVIVTLIALSFSTSLVAAKKGRPVTNSQCVNLASACMLSSDAKVANSTTRVACCSKSLGYCVVVPKDLSKSCTKHIYRARFMIQRLNQATKATLKKSIRQRRIPLKFKGTRMHAR